MDKETLWIERAAATFAIAAVIAAIPFVVSYSLPWLYGSSAMIFTAIILHMVALNRG